MIDQEQEINDRLRNQILEKIRLLNTTGLKLLLFHISNLENCTCEYFKFKGSDD